MGQSIPLLSGAYNSPAYIAAAQRCVNLFPEVNPQDIQPAGQSPFIPNIPFTHRLTPGLTRQFTFPDATIVRGLWQASNGQLYGCCGQSVYAIGTPQQGWPLTFIGNIAPGTTPVKFADNGISAMIVDGTPSGYQIQLGTNAFSGINADTASGTNGFSPPHATWVDEVDGFMVANLADSPDWQASADYAIVWDPLSIAQKSGRPDAIRALAVLHRYVWLIGSLSSEIWYNAGGTNFPFAIVAGPYIEHGTVADYSLAAADESLFWLSRDLRGQLVCLEGLAVTFAVNRVSNHAVEQEWQSYAGTADAVGMTYQQGGHTFYIVRFPSADKTWAYDRMTGQWHERVSFDADMNEHQWRCNVLCSVYGVLIGGDYENGKVYLLDDTNTTDDFVPIQRRRGYPHILNQLKRNRSSQFVLDIECGENEQEPPQPIALLCDPQPPGLNLLTDGPIRIPILCDPSTTLFDYGAPQVYLRWSTTRGRSWGNPVPRSIGFPGQYNTNPSWRRLGLARDMVFEVYWSAPMVSALNGGFLEIDPGRT